MNAECSPLLTADAATMVASILARCDELAAISELGDGILRQFLTREHQRANAQVAEWMEAAGMSTWSDAIGNQWGRYEGIVPGAPALIIGSHLDTVPYAGRYDGILGVLGPIELVAHLHSQGQRFPFAIEIVGFGDEEGTRFSATMLGSRAVAGVWDDSNLAIEDKQGISLSEALSDFGLDPTLVGTAARDAGDIVGYWEWHIEQGPVLEAENVPVGVVTGIAGARRAMITLTGRAGHAGTTPMDLRRDALCGAAELALVIENIARQAGGDVVATCGQLFIRPGAVNVIAGSAVLSLDIRSQSDALRDQIIEEINDAAETIAARRDLSLLWNWTYSVAATLCHPGFQSLFGRAVEKQGLRLRDLPSGAGHDAMTMAALCPVAMLFQRSPHGLSHHPDEAVLKEDVAMALVVLKQALLDLALSHSQA